MTTQRRVLTVLGVMLALMATIPAGAAQEEAEQNETEQSTTPPPPSGGGSSDLNGMDTEFGSIRMPVHREYDSEAAEVTARIKLKTHYATKEAKFFLFGFNLDTDSVKVNFDSLTTASGQEIRFFKDQRDDPRQPQVFVDIRDMPPVGTELVMHATATAGASGSFQVGALVIAFDYHWEKVRMDNGLEAQLYGYTTLASNKGGLLFEGKGNVPGFSLPLAVAAASLVAVGLARRRRRT